MDIEFHYYITYILADKAGFSAEDSAIIAYSCQQTDDNAYHYCINFEKENPYLTVVSQTMDITKPQEKRKTIYPIFHFFPGDPESPSAERKDGEKNSFNTTPDSANARRMFEEGLNSGNLYRIGIAAHVYADTWAHQNFCGLKDNFNAMDRFGGALIPNIGHADAAHDPDLVRHKWVDDRLVDRNCSIDNMQRFAEAAGKIFFAFKKYTTPGTSESLLQSSWEDVKGPLLEAMKAHSPLGDLFHTSQNDRIEAYRRICSAIPDYDSEGWRHEAVEKDELELDVFDKYWGKENFRQSNWYKFQEAARDHHDAAMKILGPLFP